MSQKEFPGKGGQTRLIYLVPKAPADRDRPLVVLLLLDIPLDFRKSHDKEGRKETRAEG